MSGYNASACIALTGVEALSFGPISADLHIAPAASVILAAIEKEPSAGVEAALTHVCHVRRCEQRGRGLNDWDKWPHRCGDEVRRKPMKLAFFPFDALRQADVR